MRRTAAIHPMQTVHELLSEEFGRMAPALEDDGRLQPVFLPGGTFAVVITMSSDKTITIRKAIGTPDFTRPGLADFLLTEHSRWLFARFERNDDLLAIEHTLTTDSLTAETLVRVVRAVHDAACDAEHTLTAIGALAHET